MGRVFAADREFRSLYVAAMRAALGNSGGRPRAEADWLAVHPDAVVLDQPTQVQFDSACSAQAQLYATDGLSREVHVARGSAYQTTAPGVVVTYGVGVGFGGVAAIADYDVDLYLDADVGDDANDGGEGRPVASWTRCEQLWPFGCRGAFRLHLGGSTAISVPSGQHVMPRRIGAAPPPQIMGAWAIVGGVRTILAVGEDIAPETPPNVIQDTVGGWAVPQWTQYWAYRVRFISGDADGSSYSIQRNGPDSLSLAQTWCNGAAPSAGDQYVIEAPARQLIMTDAEFVSDGPVVIWPPIAFTGSGDSGERRPGSGSIVEFHGGPWYAPGSYANMANGRVWVSGHLRTFDLKENIHPATSEEGMVLPFPALFSEYLAFHHASGDLFVGSAGSFKGCLVARYIDQVVERLGVCDVLDCDALFVNQQQFTEGAIGYFATHENCRSYIGTMVGGGIPLVYASGAAGYVRGVSVEGSQQGMFVASGANVIVEDFVGEVLAGPAARVLLGGVLHALGANTATGPGGAGAGEILVDGTDDVTWAEVEALNGTIRAGDRT